MKLLKRKISVIIIALSLIFTSVPSTCAYAAKAVRTANIYSFEGEVTIRRGGDKTLPAFEGMRLSEGDTILTGSNSKAVIAIDSDKTITVDSNTEITLDALSGDEKKNQTSTSIFNGNTSNTVKNKLTEGSTFETRTSSAVMGVRGTSYVVMKSCETLDLIVDHGTVLFTPATSVASEEKEGIPVSVGEFLHQSTSSDPTPSPVNQEILMKLSPGIADEFVTDEMLLSIPDLPEHMRTKETLLSHLSEKQASQNQEIEQKIADRDTKVHQLPGADPEPFFSTPGETIHGTSNALLAGNPDGQNQSIPASQKLAEGNMSPTPGGQTFPQTVPEGTTSPSTQPNNRYLESESQPAAPVEKPPAQEDENQPGSIPVTPAPKPDPAPKPNPTPKPDPTPTPPPVTEPDDTPNTDDDSEDSGDEDTRPEIAIGTILQDTVYEETNAGLPGQLVALTLTWKEPKFTSAYTVEIKNQNGSYSPMVPSPQIVKNGDECRIVFPKETRGNLHQSILRLTPVVDRDKRPLPSLITLNFDTASTGTTKKLSAPTNLQIVKNENQSSLSFSLVADSTSYHIGIYQGEQVISEEQISSQDTTVVYPLPGDLYGDYTASVIAMGDQYNTWDSGTTKLDFSIEQEIPKLDAPNATAYNALGKTYIRWNPVENASSYMISFSDGSNQYYVNSGFSIIYEQMGYTLTPKDMAHADIVLIRAQGANGKYLDSDWATIVIPDPPVATPSNASPSNASRRNPQVNGQDAENGMRKDNFKKSDVALLPKEDDLF